MTQLRPLAAGVTPLETRREVIRSLAEHAERLGYRRFFVAEGWGYDAPVLLAEIATRTRTIGLGTGVLNVWGRSAAGIAMLAATLDEVSAGRFTLGLGAGSPQLAEGLHEQQFHAPVQRLGAVTRQVRRLLDGQRVASADGQHGMRLAIAARPGLPIHLAALGPWAVRLAGEVADGWNPFLLPRSGLKNAIGLLEDGAGRAGRAAPRVCPGLPAAVASDPAQARALASWWVVHYLTSMGPLYGEALRRAGLGGAVDTVLAANPTRGTADVPPAGQVLLDELTVHGDAAAARVALQRWYDAGADEPVVVLPPGRPQAELDHILEALQPG